MKNNFTREEVKRILVSAVMFSSANNNQGLKAVRGENFGDKANRILETFEENQNKTILQIVTSLR